MSTPDSTTKSPSNPSGIRGNGVLLSVLILTYVAAIWRMPLGGDEAYYWVWSTHLAAGYHDHPPAVAWAGALPQMLFGFNPFAFRLAGLAMLLATAWLVGRVAGRVASRLELNPAVAFWSAMVMVLAAPLLGHYTVEMGPDSPLLFAWALALEMTSIALLEGRGHYWIWAGMAIGLGILSKLTGWVLGGSVVLLLLSFPEGRAEFKKAWLWLGVVASLLVAAPNLLWNSRNGWENYAFQWGLRVSDRSADFSHLWRTPELLADLGFLGLICIPAIVWAWPRRHRFPELRILLFFGLPIHLIFFLVRCLGSSRWNWPMPGYLSLLAITGVWLADRNSRHRFYRVAIVLTLMWTVLGSALRVSPEFENAVIATARRVYPDIKTSSADIAFALPLVGEKMKRESGPEEFWLSDYYSDASALTYYGGRPVGLILPHREGAQFSRWNDFSELLGKDALFVSPRPFSILNHVQAALERSFASYEVLPAWEIRVDDQRETIKIYPVRCRDFQRNGLEFDS